MDEGRNSRIEAAFIRLAEDVPRVIRDEFEQWRRESAEREERIIRAIERMTPPPAPPPSPVSVPNPPRVSGVDPMMVAYAIAAAVVAVVGGREVLSAILP